jgi:uncharacterized membrane protein
MIWGLKPIFLYKVGFDHIVLGFFMIFRHVNGDFGHYWKILGSFSAQILGGSWGWITNFRSIKTRPV